MDKKSLHTLHIESVWIEHSDNYNNSENLETGEH